MKCGDTNTHEYVRKAACEVQGSEPRNNVNPKTDSKDDKDICCQ